MRRALRANKLSQEKTSTAITNHMTTTAKTALEPMFAQSGCRKDPTRDTAEFFRTRLYWAPVFTVFLHDERPRKGAKNGAWGGPWHPQIKSAGDTSKQNKHMHSNHQSHDRLCDHLPPSTFPLARWPSTPLLHHCLSSSRAPRVSCDFLLRLVVIKTL